MHVRLARLVPAHERQSGQYHDRWRICRFPLIESYRQSPRSLIAEADSQVARLVISAVGDIPSKVKSDILQNWLSASLIRVYHIQSEFYTSLAQYHERRESLCCRPFMEERCLVRYTTAGPGKRNAGTILMLRNQDSGRRSIDCVIGLGVP